MNLSARWPNSEGAKRAIARAVACGLVLLLTSCGVPPLRKALPGPLLPADYPASLPGANSPENSSQLPVDAFFDDPLLICLIDQALTGNQELKALNEEIQIARSQVLSRQGAYLPFIGYRTGASLNKPSRFTIEGASRQDDPYAPGKFLPNPVPDFLLSLNLFWQVDIWRELRNARDATIQRFESAVARRDYFVTRLVADVADNYYGLLARDKRLENLNQILQVQEKTLEFARAVMQAGRSTDLPVRRFQAEVRKNQSQRLLVYQEIIETENRINFLAARYPQHVKRWSGDFVNLQLHTLSVGLPAQLLQFRPDIRQAERELAASGLDVLVARAHFFPRLDITGGVGYEAFSPKYLFWTPDALIGNVAGDLTGPLINKRAIRADYLTANARQLQSLYNYQRVILNAFTEVVNRVAMVQNYGASIELKKQQVQALEAAVEAANKLFQAARIEYVDVLFAQRDWWEARRDLIDTKQQQLSAIVNAYQALGGGLLNSVADGNCRPPRPGQPATGPVPQQPVTEPATPDGDQVLPYPKALKP